MYCNVKDCKNNTNGYCDISNYITIDENGECEDMLIINNQENEDADKGYYHL